jgi:hypothetical protein
MISSRSNSIIAVLILTVGSIVADAGSNWGRIFYDIVQQKSTAIKPVNKGAVYTGYTEATYKLPQVASEVIVGRHDDQPSNWGITLTSPRVKPTDIVGSDLEMISGEQAVLVRSGPFKGAVILNRGSIIGVPPTMFIYSHLAAIDEGFLVR